MKQVDRLGVMGLLSGPVYIKDAAMRVQQVKSALGLFPKALIAFVSATEVSPTQFFPFDLDLLDLAVIVAELTDVFVQTNAFSV